MSTTVVNVRNADGPTVYIGRPTKWGNPYFLVQDTTGARKRCVENYREYLRTRPDLITAAREELRGKKLACFCAPKLCHGDVLAAVADGEDP